MHPSVHALSGPERPACIEASSGRILSYADLDAASNQGARLLRALGLKRGDVVAAQLGNGCDIFEVAWAAQRAGLYLTTISTKLPPGDIRYVLEDSGASLLVVSDELADVARQAVAGASIAVLRAEQADEALASWRELRRGFDPTPIDDESPGGEMLYSSGTTGRPKGVKPPLPAGSIADPTPLTRMGAELYGMGADTTYLSTSPLYHAAPLRWAMTVQRLGGAVVVMDKFEPEPALTLIERHRVTHATWVPTHFVRLLKLPAEIRGRYRLTSMRAAIHAAAPCPAPVKRAMLEWWGPILYEYYSGTETCGITAISPDEWLRKPGSVGRAILGEVRILGDDGQELGPRQEGLVYFAGGPRFEYHNDPEKTARAYNGRGWATMGDVGWTDDDGYLFLTDRKDFMIISGGVNIYPQEIENLLISHPKVADVAVIGAPDPEMGEKVVAVVQPNDWAEAGPDLGEELRRFARENLGGVKTPRAFDFRPTLPREPTGKLMKKDLRKEYWAAEARDGGACDLVPSQASIPLAATAPPR